MRGVRNTDRNARKFITIVDDFKCEYIARLMEKEEYNGDFNKVINDALDYGLPQLLKVAYGEIEEDGLPCTQPQGYELIVNDFDSDQLAEVLDLLEEVLLNATLNKSMVASLFKERTKQLGGQTVNPDSFQRGELSTTPPYLAEYERIVLDRVSKSRKERAGRDEGGGN